MSAACMISWCVAVPKLGHAACAVHEINPRYVSSPARKIKIVKKERRR